MTAAVTPAQTPAPAPPAELDSAGGAPPRPARGAPWRPLRWALRGLSVAGTALLALVFLGPLVLPFRAFAVLSNSMEPTLPVGSLVVAQPVAGERLAVGDVITFNHPDRPGMLVTHRIVGREDRPEGPTWVTKGDANGAPDAWRVPATGDGLRHRFTVPHAGRALSVLQSAPGRLALLAVGAVTGAGRLLWRLWRPGQDAERAERRRSPPHGRRLPGR